MGCDTSASGRIGLYHRPSIARPLESLSCDALGMRRRSVMRAELLLARAEYLFARLYQRDRAALSLKQPGSQRGLRPGCRNN